MLISLWILGISTAVASGELTGDNICEVEESYPVNVTEYSWRNATVRNYKWCLGFPPRCSFYTIKTVRIPNIVKKFETRIIKRCCTGYAENSRHDGCIECKKCFYGFCGNDGECICNAGFKGVDCSEACEAMQWGIDCQFKCLCERGNCDPRTGLCDCPSGWFGTRCELLCLEGFYGKHCIHRCNCGERELCSSQTGQCAIKSTYRQEHQSTRAIHYLTDDILNFTKIINKQKSTPSLKKYHTFDMELSTDNPHYPRITEATTQKIPIIRNEKWKPYTSRKTEPNISMINALNTNWPKTNMNSLNTTKRNHEKSKINAKEDYVESTTEISSEVLHNEGLLPLLNENESLEHKDSTETTDSFKQRQHSEGNKTVIKDGVIRNGVIDSKSSETLKKHKNDKSLNVIQIKLTPTSNRKNSAERQNARDSWTKFQTTTDVSKSSINKNSSPKYKNHMKNSSTPKVKKVSKTELKKNDEKGINTPRDSRDEYINNRNISFKYPSKAKVHVEITLETEINNQHDTKSNNTTTYRRFKSNSNKVKNTETTNKSNNYVVNIPPILESTSPILNNKKQYMENINQNVEEDKLQNLDTKPILTSRDTSTSVTGNQDSATIAGEIMLPFPNEIPSSKSTNSLTAKGNELFTTSITEIQIPSKDSFDFRQTKDDNNYLSDEASGEYEYSSTDKSNLVTHVSIAVFTSLILIMIMSSMILMHYYSRRRRNPTTKMRSEHHQNYPGGPTVSVYTHSIFHTPLPDPPTFENPVFITPSENSIDHRTFQTHLVCSLNFPGQHRPDQMEYTYDHPPSTGSYRAASIPEPPDVDEILRVEPLYDEIPCHIRDKTLSPSYKSSCIYVNTCGKTKF